MEFASQGQSFCATQSGEHFESFIARQVAKYPGVVRIILDDEQDRILGMQVLSVVRYFLHRMFGDHDVGQLQRQAGCLYIGLAEPGSGWSHVGQRQKERERAALTGSTFELNLPTEKACQFAADRESESGAAVLAARTGICLLEGLEDDALLIRRDSNAGVGYFECDHGSGVAQNRMIFTPPSLGNRDRETYRTLLSELKGVRE